MTLLGMLVNTVRTLAPMLLLALVIVACLRWVPKLLRQAGYRRGWRR